MNHFKTISTATASQDLKMAVDNQLLKKTGDKNNTVYRGYCNSFRLFLNSGPAGLLKQVCRSVDDPEGQAGWYIRSGKYPVYGIYFFATKSYVTGAINGQTRSSAAGYPLNSLSGGLALHGFRVRRLQRIFHKHLKSAYIQNKKP